jgi:hypothetical protein
VFREMWKSRVPIVIVPASIEGLAGPSRQNAPLPADCYLHLLQSMHSMYVEVLIRLQP